MDNILPDRGVLHHNPDRHDLVGLDTYKIGTFALRKLS